MFQPSWAAALALAAVPACVAAAPAVSIGNLLSVSEDRAAGTPAQWTLRTDRGVRVQLELLRTDVFRIWAGMHDALTGPGDKAAHIVVGEYRDPVPHQWQDAGDHWLLTTDAIALRLYKRPMRLALYRADNRTLVWQEAQPLVLGGQHSVQTLSSNADEHFFGGGQQNGGFEFKGRELPISYSGGWEEGDRPNPAPFFMSSRGWGMLRNTWSKGRYDFRLSDQLTTTHDEDRFDAYYFVGDSIHEVLARYTELTGRAKLLPRWAYEYGDADCYNDADNAKKPGTVPPGWHDGPTGTTPDVIDSVARRYREHDMPGGWILPNDGYGCGYTDLPKVVHGLKQYGFHTGLWTENGVQKIAWEVGTAGTRAQKLDVAWTGQGYQHALDANQSAYDGIVRNADARPFIWTVMGWAGVQRYAVTWTGDQSGSWDYIRWHVPTVIGSGLSGQVYATGDVDGIFGGSPETFTRDLQWKAFTPVLMGMSGWSAAERKHPWWFDEPYRSINRKFLKLKMRLMPLMYTLAWEAERTGAPIVRGLMWDHPDDPSAFSEAHKQQFFLGRDLLVAPVFHSQAASEGWRRDIYLPHGRWISYGDGRVVDVPAQGRTLDMKVTLDTLPVFVRAGAILPMYPEMLYDGQRPKDELTLDLYPGGHSDYTLYEDDGLTRQYQQGRFALQRIVMTAPDGKSGDVAIDVGAVEGSYDGQEPSRGLRLQVHTRAAPRAVEHDGQALAQLADRAAFEAAAQGWFYDPMDHYGTVHVKWPSAPIRERHRFVVQIDEATRMASTADFPAAPPPGRAVPRDSLTVVSRPQEEPGHPLENAFDGSPGSWFRTVRNQAVKSGPHEWVLNLGERRLVDGIELAPRNDANWRYGQPRDVEVYLGDNSGDWGAPVARGRLKLSQRMQTLSFAPRAGRLLRFRVLSVHNPDGDDAGTTDPMVLAAQGATPAGAYDALLPAEVPPITLSEFHVLEHPASLAPLQQRYLSDVPLRGVAKDKALRGGAMRMNGLGFRKGLGVRPGARVDLRLRGDWQLFRADVGIDDHCRAAGGVHFQVWGDGRLLYDSGEVRAPAVVKPEIDVRGLQALSLRTLPIENTDTKSACANWANALLVGHEGDAVEAGS